MPTSTGNRTIAKNATMLYFRMFFTMAISFYTSRLVLQALGISDYGIYNVVGGITAMISIFISSLGSSTSRFLTYALGEGNPENLNITFSTAALVHLGLALAFVIAAETLGLWFVNTQIVVPEGRMVAANWVYQASIVAVTMSIIQVPYSASITSHEQMTTYAYVEVLNAICKLAIAIMVLYSSSDKLILYSILYAAMSILFQLFYRYYCVRKFSECHIVKQFDKALFKHMMAYSGWSMVGSATLTLKNQGVNVLINRFFGTLLNAASGVALQVQGLLYAFTSNITIAFNPQIIKSYAVSDYERVNELIGLGTKFTALVTILTVIPLSFNMDFLMSIWLKDVPKGAVVICQILLFANFLNSFNTFINTAIVASGKIKHLNLSLSVFYVLILFSTYIVLKIGYSYELAYIVTLISCPLSTVVYLVLLKNIMPSFSARVFLKVTYFPLFAITLASVGLVLALSNAISSPLLSFLITTITCSVFVMTTAYLFLFDQHTRGQIREYVALKLMK